MSENELSNGFDTDGISKLNHETDDADEENIDISTTKSENNYEDNFDIPVQKKINEKKSPRMVRLSTVILIVLLSITTVLLVFFAYLFFSNKSTDTTDSGEPITNNQMLGDIDFTKESIEDFTDVLPDETIDISEYILFNSDSIMLTETDLEFLSDRELELARNEIYARHGRKFNTDYIQQYFDSKSWYKGTIDADKFDDSVLNDIEKYNIEFIRNYEYERSLSYTEFETTHTKNSASKEEQSSKTPKIKVTEPIETTPKVKLTTLNVKGVKFNYVKSFNSDFEYSDDVLDYDINIDVQYCKPEDYCSENDHLVSLMPPSNGMYDKENIGNLYYTANDEDFVIFKVNIKGNYNIEFYTEEGYCEFRKYTPSGAVLKNFAGITDYEIFSINSEKGSVNEEFYIGFHKSEVSRVDFKLFCVGPNGFGQW